MPEKLEVLSRIWARTFELGSVRPNDNFLAMGGDREKAETIAIQAGILYGREVSPLLILQAPTVSTMAEVLSQSELPRITPLVPLSNESEGPPIFLTHGLGGTVLSLLPLARALQSSHAIYGMQAPGLDGVKQPLNRIEAMAEYYLQEIQRLQPSGPYYLVGYSLGGLVALEISRRLLDGGQKIGVLTMLDSYVDRRHFAVAERIRWEWSQTGRRTVDAWRELQSRLNAMRGRKNDNPQESGMLARAAQRVTDAQYEALRSYEPRYYEGRVTFISATTKSYFPADPTAIWGRVVRELEIHTLTGNHLDMLGSHVNELASIVRCLLQETLGETPSLRLIS